MNSIETLEKIARELDPGEGQRSLILNRAIDYTNQYLNNLPGEPGFGYSHFEKLSSLKIEDSGKPIESLLEVLKTEVDIAGISSASGRHLGFIPGGGLWASALADMLSDITNKYSGIAFSGPGAV